MFHPHTLLVLVYAAEAKLQAAGCRKTKWNERKSRCTLTQSRANSHATT